MKLYKLYLLIVVLSLFPLIHIFITPGLPHTSDGLVHTARFAEYYRQTIDGQFPVRWASQFNFGYGSPLFNFSHPLPYIFSLPFVALGVPLVMVLKITFATTYLLAGIFMLMFTLAYFRKDVKTAFFVTIMYQYAPFRLVEMLVRGSIGSLWAYVFLPLIFFSITKFVETLRYRYFALLALSVGLLLLSHNVLGMVFFAISVLYVFFVTKNRKTLLLTLSAIALGVGLAAFFVIPVTLEYKYINSYIYSKHLFYLHFPSLLSLFLPNITNAEGLRTAEISVQIGLFHVLGLFVMTYFLLKKKLEKSQKLLSLYILIVTLVTLFFVVRASTPLWENIRVLRQFQFPWRLLAILCFTSALASSFAITKIKFLRRTRTYVVLIALVIVSTIFYWAPYQGYQHFDQAYFWNFPKSTTYFGDVNTIWMANEPTEFPKKRIEAIAGNAVIDSVLRKPTKHTFTVRAENTATILDRIYFYPGWRVKVDEQEVPVQFQDQNYRGLITFPVNSGEHKAIVYYSQNRLEQMSNVVSIFTVCVLVAGAIFFYRRRKNER